MIRYFAAFILTALAFAPAASAEWIINGTTATWRVDHDLSVVQEARTAILWERSRRPLMGAIFTAALPQLSVTDLGGGQGRIAIVMGRTAFDAWAAELVAVICPEAVTNPEKLACSDAAIKADVRQVIHRYNVWSREQTTPVPEPPEFP